MGRTAKPRKPKATAKNDPSEALDELFQRCFPQTKKLVKEKLEAKDNIIIDAADNVIVKRRMMKEMLEPCFVDAKMPATPKKNFKMNMKHRVKQILDFSAEGMPTTSNENHVDLIQVKQEENPIPKVQNQVDIVQQTASRTDIVVDNLQTHTHLEVHVTQASSIPAHMTPVKTAPIPSPRSKLRTITNVPGTPQLDVVPGTPEPPIVKPIPRKVVKPTKDKKVVQEQLKRKQDLATQKRAELQMEKKERMKYENEQRKRRVEENRLKKEKEEAAKKQEHKHRHEVIKKFQEAQRMTPHSPMTPRQQHVPLKKSKPQTTPLTRPKPLNIEPEPIQVDVKEEIDQLNFNDEIELINVSFGNKENNVASVASTPAQQRLNQSAYEMTPDKVHVPSTDNDYNVADLSSNDETDNEDEPRKTVPSWAQKEALRVHTISLRQRMTQEQINNHFGQVIAPDVNVIFGKATRKSYRNLDETTAWDSPIGNPRPAPLMLKAANRRPRN